LKILIVAPAWVGDMVMAQSLLKLLQARGNGAVVDVAAPSWTLDLLARMPEVRRAIALPLAHGELGLKKRWALGSALRRERYDQAIVLPNSWKSALVPFAAGIPRRTGYVGEFRYGLLNDVRYLNKKARWLMVDRFNALGVDERTPLPEAPLPSLRADAAAARRAVEKLGLTTTTPVLALCPGAEYGAAKRWPVAHFAELARAKARAGWAVWLFGSAKDAPVTQAIAAASAGACVDLAGRTSLGEAIDLLSLAHAVVTNDSGLMHVAAALGRPLVALFGSSDPSHTPPLSPTATVLYRALDCSPCFARECPLGHTRCLNDITPTDVLAALPPV